MQRSLAAVISGVVWIAAAGIGLRLGWQLLAIAMVYVCAATIVLTAGRWSRAAIIVTWAGAVALLLFVLGPIDSPWCLPVAVALVVGTALLGGWLLVALLMVAVTTRPRASAQPDVTPTETEDGSG